MPLLTLCVEGTKGAGKSTTIEKLTQHLTLAGYEVVVCAPFTAANSFAQSRGFESARDMISESRQDNQSEIDFIRTTIATAREGALQKAVATKPVVLIYDRGWMTILPHLFGGRWHAEDHAQSEEITKIWDQVLADAPPTIFLHASFEITKQRRSRPDQKGGLDTDEKLRKDVEERTAFANMHGDKIVLSFDTGKVLQGRVVKRIGDYVRASLELPGKRGRSRKTLNL